MIYYISRRIQRLVTIHTEKSHRPPADHTPAGRSISEQGRRRNVPLVQQDRAAHFHQAIRTESDDQSVFFKSFGVGK